MSVHITRVMNENDYIRPKRVHIKKAHDPSVSLSPPAVCPPSSAVLGCNVLLSSSKKLKKSNTKSKEFCKYIS